MADKPVENQTQMTDKEREELEFFRAERKAAEEAEANRAKANLDTNPRTERELFLTLSIDDQIRAHYLHGRGTIQDYARMFHKTVEEVLHILGLDELREVETVGDLIDPSDLNPTDAPVQVKGQTARVPFSTN